MCKEKKDGRAEKQNERRWNGKTLAVQKSMDLVHLVT